MCRAKDHGGRRCQMSQARRDAFNKQRRQQYWKNKTENDVRKLEAEWGGETHLDLSSPTLVRAYQVAVIAHSGVKRQTGETYINHPLRVAKHLQEQGFNDEVVSTALLHDAVEDSDLTLEDLSERHGFSKTIVDAVDSVTKRDGEAYDDAITRATDNPIGRLVKMSDNYDNSDPNQMDSLSVKKRLKCQIKYTEARRALWESIYGQTEAEGEERRVQVMKLRSYRLSEE